MLADKRISLMLAANGGIGSYEMMDKVDYRLIKKSKKPVMGLSDVSALLNSINAKTGVITYHGPTLCYGIVHPNNPRRIEPRTYAEFISFLRHGCKEIKPAKKYRVLRKGTGKGVLAGGNLYVFSGLIGTPYINRGRLVLFFEDVGIDVADVKRAMYQLKGSGVLDRTEGMILGHFEGITRRGAGCGIACLEKSIMEAIKGYDFPVLSGAMFGHDSPNTIIPVGAKAEVSNEVGLLTRIGGVL
jgi:muramoyltetrapeptide carboxypeptidase